MLFLCFGALPRLLASTGCIVRDNLLLTYSLRTASLWQLLPYLPYGMHIRPSFHELSNTTLVKGVLKIWIATLSTLVTRGAKTCNQLDGSSDKLLANLPLLSHLE